MKLADMTLIKDMINLATQDPVMEIVNIAGSIDLKHIFMPKGHILP